MAQIIPQFLTVVASLMLALSVWHLTQTYVDFDGQGPAISSDSSSGTSDERIDNDLQQAVERPWLPIFGVTRRGLPKQSIPSDIRFDYQLKGVVATGSMRWAILTKGGKDLLVRQGDQIGDDIEIAAIHAEGIEVRLPGGTLNVGFKQNQPVEIRRLADPSPKPKVPDQKFATMLPSKETTKIIFQGMTQEDVLKFLQQAETERQKRGYSVKDR